MRRAEQVVQLQSCQGPWCMGIAGRLCALKGNWQISMQEAFGKGRELRLLQVSGKALGNGSTWQNQQTFI